MKKVQKSNPIVEEFFYLYDKKLKDNPQLKKMKKLLSYYNQIKREITEQLLTLSKENYLEHLNETLLYDAKLQILFFFWCDKELFDQTEKQIIEISELDSKKFYRESMDIHFGNLPTPFILR
ncbi:hypothetical protein JZO80_04615 [Vagococcus fluvialis]|uniref:DUF7006 family protein n=1 Tax=Vagococcus fluvialis TaxID=2738 RepID=UPI000A336979|nr:hypothetical protein [Vagococcus fluvialis]MBO0419437.1 hypothetical protein [Vagococcus fluvialis]OTP33295.1 hypothetical protein A5798_000024 [Enterococcus sp. 6C8_DIV0013]